MSHGDQFQEIVNFAVFSYFFVFLSILSQNTVKIDIFL